MQRDPIDLAVDIAAVGADPAEPPRHHCITRAMTSTTRRSPLAWRGSSRWHISPYRACSRRSTDLVPELDALRYLHDQNEGAVTGGTIMSIVKALSRLAAQFKPSGTGATEEVLRGAQDSPVVAFTIAQRHVEAQEAVCKLLEKKYPRAVAEVEKRTQEHQTAQQDVKNGTAPTRAVGFAAPFELWSEDAQIYHHAIETLAKLKQAAIELYEPVKQNRIASALAASGLPALAQEPPPPAQTAFPVDAVTAKTMEKVLGLQFGPNGELINASDSSRSTTAPLPVETAMLPAPKLSEDAKSIMMSIGNLCQVPEKEVRDAVEAICKNIERLPGAEPIVRAFLFSKLVNSASELVSLTQNPSNARNALVYQIGAAWAKSLGAVQKLSVQLPQQQAAMQQLKNDMILYIKYHVESQSGTYKGPTP
jgi:hypothetical protein